MMRLLLMILYRNCQHFWQSRWASLWGPRFKVRRNRNYVYARFCIYTGWCIYRYIKVNDHDCVNDLTLQLHNMARRGIRPPPLLSAPSAPSRNKGWPQKSAGTSVWCTSTSLTGVRNIHTLLMTIHITTLTITLLIFSFTEVNPFYRIYYR